MKKRPSRPQTSPERHTRILASLVLGISFVCIVIFAAWGLNVSPSQSKSLKSVVDLTNLKLEIADTDAARVQGLSGREGLDTDAGELFVFDKSDFYPFWMKDMKFALDIIWINNDRVVDVVTLPPPSPNQLVPATHVPLVRADSVLEVNAGKASQLGLVPGAQVILPK